MALTILSHSLVDRVRRTEGLLEQSPSRVSTAIDNFDLKRDIALGMEELHNRLCRQTVQLKSKRNFVRNRTSVHVVSNTLSLKTVSAFYQVAVSERLQSGCYVGSIDGEMVLSINTERRDAPPAAPLKKRKRGGDEEDQAERAVQKVKRVASDVFSDDVYKNAKDAIVALLKIRGPLGENVLESWSLSMRSPGQWGANRTSSLIISFRITAGVAVSLQSLTEAIKGISDGLFTVEESQVPEEFRLPQSEQGHESSSHGTKSLSVFVTVA